MKKTWTQKINQLKLAKWARQRWGRREQVEKSKKKYNRKHANPKIDPERCIEGTVED